MKTYKLIKIYPGSPKLGTITTEGRVESWGRAYLYDKDMCITDTAAIENSPEFWEEVKEEKEYEILSYSHVCIPGLVITPDIEYDGANPDTNFIGARERFKAGASDIKIHSIRRNSDGEVFTVGDRIQHTRGPSPIESIDVREDWIGGLRIMCKDREGNSLSTLRHAKPPLFITEDNVPIYEGDEYWYIHEGYPNEVYTIKRCKSSVLGDNVKRFSTKQAAEEYIAKNKVLFVTEDGVGIKEGEEFWVTEANCKPWIAIAKKKQGKYWNIIEDHSPDSLFFSTHEKAQEYIDENKPKYSKKQIAIACNNLGWSKGPIQMIFNNLDK